MKKITILDIQRMKDEGKKITMLTAYDYPLARLFDESGVEILLVGDSLGPVVAGYDNTLPVTVEELIYHTRAVVRGRENALVVADMPFMSYQVSIEDAKRNAGRVIKETGAEAVKLEGGQNMADTIRAITDIDIPVMAHIGLTPQSIHRMGGHRVQGREEKQREKLLADALAVQEAGAFSLVLEGIPTKLGEEITKKLTIPTIGIGAGIHCDGQVLVSHDLLGLFLGPRPSFVKAYCNLKETISGAVGKYLDEVRTGKFPDEEHSYR
ncbi:MAG: 3-methyl-2-oxobutanoate hydroxymethyltransferase [Deltaproteobacteria bacterium]|nr:MAG: 3-methyl-2-oxobutanoate hydroxymethyltransferase [Deltaproteobacteria bacterium]